MYKKMNRCFRDYFSMMYVTSGAILLTACGAGSKHNTLGDLEYKPKQEEAIEFKKLSHAEVRQEYKEILDLVEDNQLKEQIERRIADVYMMEGVYNQNEKVETQPKSYYVDAIKSYRNILDKYPDSPDNAEVLYQLAKAYDMEGDQQQALQMLTQLTTKHPYYPQIPEAYFRIGDIHFNHQRYREAESAYRRVIQLDNPKLKTNAHYMLGWSQYKLARYENSLDAFTYVLGQLLVGGDDLTKLNKAEEVLVSDTLHSISLALDKVGGAGYIASIDKLYTQSYVWMVYDNLGDYYSEKELYGEAVSSYRHFVDNFPNAAKAPTLHSKIIETYIVGKFPRQALEEKEKYTLAYGIRSSYAGNKNGMPAEVASHLKVYLDELARHHYSRGKSAEDEIATLNEQLEKGTDPKAIKSKKAEVQAVAKESYRKAAHFYAQYADTFPKDERIDEVYFLKAEALFAAELYDQAVADYERVAYQPYGTSANEHLADAGYAAIISYQKHIATLNIESKEAKSWQAKAVESMLKFAEVFHKDTRSPSVLTNAAEYLFSLNQYGRAITVSQNLISSNEKLDKTLKKTAYGIMAHSYFKLDDFQNAENSYASQRQLVDRKSEEFVQISERLGATIYKKSVTILNGGDKSKAVEELLKIKLVTPDSEARVPAQYDAATLLLEMEKWDAAIVELNELNAKFSDHELAVEFPRKLAFAYEKNSQWPLAADAYMVLFDSDPDQEVRREALFLAASMFEKNQNYSTAVTHFKRYAGLYEQPFATRMEARYRLALNYEKLGELDKQQYWLQQIIDNEKTAGAERTERVQWLAAWANTKYGDHFAETFRKIQLNQPIANSIPRKNEVMAKASDYYQDAASFGILEFVTQSSFKIAQLYQEFATGLRKAPPPAGLSGEEIKVYAEIIEEYAQPMDQLAMEVHQANIDRGWSGQFNDWIAQSFEQMRILNPTRFNKSELIVSYGDEIR